MMAGGSSTSRIATTTKQLPRTDSIDSNVSPAGRQAQPRGVFCWPLFRRRCACGTGLAAGFSSKPEKPASLLQIDTITTAGVGKAQRVERAVIAGNKHDKFLRLRGKLVMATKMSGILSVLVLGLAMA